MEREACVCDHGFERSDLCAEIIIIIIIIAQIPESDGHLSCMPACILVRTTQGKITIELKRVWTKGDEEIMLENERLVKNCALKGRSRVLQQMLAPTDFSSPWEHYCLPSLIILDARSSRCCACRCWSCSSVNWGSRMSRVEVIFARGVENRIVIFIYLTFPACNICLVGCSLPLLRGVSRGWG